MDAGLRERIAEAKGLIVQGVMILRGVRGDIPKTPQNILTRNALLTLIKTLDLMIEFLYGWSVPAKEVESLYNSVCDEE